jgi:hypothetical protein
MMTIDPALEKNCGGKLVTLQLVSTVDREGARLTQYLAYFMWTGICGQGFDFQPITRALVWELNVRAAVIG